MGKQESKMVLMLDYTRYVVDESVAIDMMRILNRCEIYKCASKWDSNTKTSTEYLERLTDVHLKPMPPDTLAVLRLATAAIEEQREKEKN